MTNEFEDNKNILAPSVNVVFVSIQGDTDQYGAQKRRDELVPHITSQAGTKRYWREVTIDDVRHLFTPTVKKEELRP